MAEVVNLKYMGSQRDIPEISKYLKENLAAEVVCSEMRFNEKALMLCFEDFYFRVGNYVSLSIFLTKEDDYIEAVVVGFGGGDGFNWSMGANKSFAKRAIKELEKIGFMKIISDD